MKKKIILAVAAAGLAAFLGIQSGVAYPVLEAIYCKVLPQDC